jgi:hypothetical protein
MDQPRQVGFEFREGDGLSPSQWHARTVFKTWKQSRRVCRKRSGRNKFESGLAVCRLFQAPEGRIRLHQFESRVPRFVAAPDDFGFRLAPRFLLDQTDAFV